ncbi:MAG: deoxyribose-phosphate aldolase, partial [Candidatus Thorarchaeota archaeon]
MDYSQKEFAKFFDHTLLKANAREENIRKVAEETIAWKFASLTINPVWVPFASKLLQSYPDIHVNACIGFPLGAISTELKAMETKAVVTEGATEIDMVCNIAMILDEQWDDVRNDIKAVVEAAGKNQVKVIIETCYLSDDQKIQMAKIVAETGAAFIKTSTGFGPAGATVHDVMLLYETVKGKIGVKAAGGIRHFKDALEMINAGATR